VKGIIFLTHLLKSGSIKITSHPNQNIGSMSALKIKFLKLGQYIYEVHLLQKI
jgi:hypothetical protein